MFEHNAAIRVGYQEFMVGGVLRHNVNIGRHFTPPSGLLATRHKDTPKQLAFNCRRQAECLSI